VTGTRLSVWLRNIPTVTQTFWNLPPTQDLFPVLALCVCANPHPAQGTLPATVTTDLRP